MLCEHFCNMNNVRGIFRLRVNCPRKCTPEKKAIWGTDIYWSIVIRRLFIFVSSCRNDGACQRRGRYASRDHFKSSLHKAKLTVNRCGTLVQRCTVCEGSVFQISLCLAEAARPEKLGGHLSKTILPWFLALKVGNNCLEDSRKEGGKVQTNTITRRTQKRQAVVRCRAGFAVHVWHCIPVWWKVLQSFEFWRDQSEVRLRLGTDTKWLVGIDKDSEVVESVP